MDGFTYHDIFQTKGIEYLIIIAFFMVLIPFWIMINRKTKFVAKMQDSLSRLTTSVLKIPKGVFYSQHHTWAFLEKSGSAQVGIDDWLLHITGASNVEALKTVGETVKKGDVISTLVKDGKSLKILSPISGTILKANSKVFEAPEKIIENPFDGGWLYKIEPANWKAETNQYYLGEDSKAWYESEMSRFKDFVAVSMAESNANLSNVVLQEGGELMDFPLAEMNADVWNNFQNEFLK
jgi:glycine cleavage system H protein